MTMKELLSHLTKLNTTIILKPGGKGTQITIGTQKNHITIATKTIVITQQH